jgi:drug/metabolite transporter (DMT)-like permease
MLNDLRPGTRYMLSATLLFALVNVCIKKLPGLPALEIILFRGVISLVLTAAALAWEGVSPWAQHQPKALFWRGMAGTAALVLDFFLIKAVPLAPAVTLQYLSPIFTAMLGILVVKEPVRTWQWVFFAVSFAGVVVGQGVGSLSWQAILLGIGAAFCSGLSYTFIRRIKDREHPLVIILWFQLVTVPVAAVWCLFDWTMPLGTQWWWLLATALLTHAALWCITKSYQLEQAASAAALNYVGLLYAAGFGFWFFGEQITPLLYLGMGLVLLGVVLNTWYTAHHPPASGVLPRKTPQ